MFDSLFSEVREVRVRGIRYVLALAVAMTALLTLSLSTTEVRGVTLPWLSVAGESVASQVLAVLKGALVPAGVELVVLDPFAPFVALVGTAFLLSFVVTLPYLVHLALGYLGPALTRGEQRVLLVGVGVAVLLFALGAGFALVAVIPTTFSALYAFAPVVGAAPLFSLSSFIATTLALTFATGVLFLLPVVMVLATFVGLVPAQWWRAHWRVATVCALIFAAVITPDGSGITMLLLAGPMTVLYGAGAALSGRAERSSAPQAVHRVSN